MCEMKMGKLSSSLDACGTGLDSLRNYVSFCKFFLPRFFHELVLAFQSRDKGLWALDWKDRQ